ncbi:acyl-CoA synthetase [Haladaptatus sp. CMAA 1911]|uniref:acyl-CoA synthetase n=1 Tax=unclassified Haladaptatus TaxID=2622732 RepID=UPI003755386C
MTVGDYPESRIEAYHFYEQEWESYEELRSGFEWDVPDQVNMAEYVCDRHASRKNEVALFYEDEKDNEGSYTFWQLKQRTNQLANYLSEWGLNVSDRVAVCVPQKPETVIGHVGIWKIGGVSVPLSTLFGPDALRYRLADSETRVIVADACNLENVREVKGELDMLEKVLVVGDVDDLEADETRLWDAIQGSDRSFEIVETEAEDDAVIPYTSGTTGDPKGVVYPHRVIFGHLPGFICNFTNADLRTDDVFWHPTGWAWVGSFFDLVLPALYYGKPVLAYENYSSFDPEKPFELVERYGLTCLYIPPTALRMMMNSVDKPTERYTLDSVRVLGSGGEAVGKTLPEWADDVFGATIHEAYGQTEGTILFGNCSRYFEYRQNIGKPMPGFDADVLDPRDHSPVPDGEIGEIAVITDNPTIFKGYLGKPEKTREKFAGDYMLTEDLGVRDEDGYFDYKSRKDDVIISAGYRIGPEEVEDVLSKHDAVADAGIIGVPDEERGSTLKAFVTLNEGYTGSDSLAADIGDFVKDRLAKYEYPREVEFIDELPKTATGKIRRKTLDERENL